MGDGRQLSRVSGARAEDPPPPRRSDGELAILYETIKDLTSTLSVREVIQSLIERALVHLESEIASILLLGSDRKLRIEHARGLPDQVVETTCLELGDGISGYVAQRAEPLLIEDIERDTRFRRRNHERYYTNSAISAPLMIRGEVMGVINVNNKRSHEPYLLRDLRLVEAIAGHAAVALLNARRYEETLERAQRDALTGLANHGHFWSWLEVEIERGQRYGRQLSIAMADIDHFKGFNDRFGHLSGDEALAGVAKVIAGCSRVNDFAARYGGEEFAILLPETDKAGAVAFAEKFRQSVAAAAFSGAEPGALTVSVGIATFPADAKNPRDLVEAADVRLYKAKAGGRNRVCSRD